MKRKIYVASSWRNEFYPEVVEALIVKTDMTKFGDIVPIELAQIGKDEIVPIEMAQISGVAASGFAGNKDAKKHVI